MKLDLNKKLSNKTNFNLGVYDELKSNIMPLIQQGVPTKKIRKDFNLTNKQITFLIMYNNNESNFFKILGSKTESYYSEKEIMKPISYSYKDLSPDEKLIYNEI